MRVRTTSLRRTIAAAFFATVAVPALAQDNGAAPPPYDNAVFLFGGAFQSANFGHAFFPLTAPYEDAYLIGGGYQRTLWTYGDGRFGTEVGLAARHGDKWSGEAWAGVFARYDGYVLADTLRISPSITFGLSATTGTVGSEAKRVKDLGHSDPLLFYLGPEVDFSLVDHPQWEVFWRIQHRSGGFGTIADIDASNGETLGIRYKF